MIYYHALLITSYLKRRPSLRGAPCPQTLFWLEVVPFETCLWIFQGCQILKHIFKAAIEPISNWGDKSIFPFIAVSRSMSFECVADEW